MSWLDRLMKFLASLQLAVIVIVLIAVISAVGTIVEAKYDAQYAQKIVYHSWYMYLTLGLLCVNLIHVMIDRWPWQKKHTAFVLAHIGIIILLLGSLVTRHYGIDGSMTFDIGAKGRYVSLSDTELAVYSSFGEGRFSQMYRSDVDFLIRPPQKSEYSIQLGAKKIELLEYYHYANRKVETVASDDKNDPPALRFQIQNANVNMTQWILRDRRAPYDKMELGPAQVILSDGSYKYQGGNEIVFTYNAKNDLVEYAVYSKRLKKMTTSGVAKVGEVVNTGWMDLKLRFLKVLPQAVQQITYEPQNGPGAFTMAALKLKFDGKEHWVGLNSVLKLFTDVNVYMLTFGNKRIDLGFDLELKKFEVGRYQGTMRAASYSSLVKYGDNQEVLISMNNPLKYKGYTFYQASFSQDDSGKPVASILSVNKDPGRPIKYLGSFLIVLGSIMLFYFKKAYMKKKKVSDEVD